MSAITLKTGDLAAVPRSLLISRQLRYLAVVTAVLVVSGCVASFSTTVFLRIAQGLPPYTAFFKHLVFLGIGAGLSLLVILAFCRFAPYKRWLKFVIPVLFFCMLGLVFAVKFSSHGVEMLGATRMLNLGFIQFQPSELLKIAIVLYMAQLLCWWRRNSLSTPESTGWVELIRSARYKWLARLQLLATRRPGPSRLPYRSMAALLAAFGFTVIQPDIGSACIILGAGLITAGIAGVRPRDFAVFILGIVMIGGLALLVSPSKYNYALNRLNTWVDPLENADSSSYQITQARGAIAGGGVWGKGYLKSDQKMNRLPLSTNDFVFPVMVEELGFIGGVAIIGMFLALGFAGVQLAATLNDPFAQTVVAALGLTVCLQGLVNIATTIGSLPLSGMTLPFFSQGGTSVVTSVLAVGTMFALGLRGLLDARLLERQSGEI